jgi:hypothetical protein
MKFNMVDFIIIHWEITLYNNIMLWTLISCSTIVRLKNYSLRLKDYSISLNFSALTNHLMRAIGDGTIRFVASASKIDLNQICCRRLSWKSLKLKNLFPKMNKRQLQQKYSFNIGMKLRDALFITQIIDNFSTLLNWAVKFEIIDIKTAIFKSNKKLYKNMKLYDFYAWTQ